MLKGLILIFLIFSHNSHAEFINIPRLNILASSSMTNVLSILIKEYTKKNNITIMVKYGASQKLRNDISLNPEEVDIFISSKEDVVKELLNKSFINRSTLTPLFRNRLVLISSKENKISKIIKPSDSFSEILKKIRHRSTLVIADPEDSLLGSYSMNLLKTHGMWKYMIPVMERSENSVSTVHLGSAGYRTAIVYQSDIYHNNNLTKLLQIPLKSHTPIIYQAMALNNHNEFYSRKFLKFLKSKYAQEKFEEFGFEKLTTN